MTVSIIPAIPAEGGSDVTKCSFGNGGTDTYRDKNKKREQIASCFVDNKQFGDCNPENKFGYRLGEPCMLIKLNRVRTVDYYTAICIRHFYVQTQRLHDKP